MRRRDRRRKRFQRSEREVAKIRDKNNEPKNENMGFI